MVGNGIRDQQPVSRRVQLDIGGDVRAKRLRAAVTMSRQFDVLLGKETAWWSDLNRLRWTRKQPGGLIQLEHEYLGGVPSQDVERVPIGRPNCASEIGVGRERERWDSVGENETAGDIEHELADLIEPVEEDKEELVRRVEESEERDTSGPDVLGEGRLRPECPVGIDRDDRNRAVP